MPDPGRPEDLIGRPAPGFSLPSTQGGAFSSDSLRGRCPLVLFFYIHNGTPG